MNLPNQLTLARLLLALLLFCLIPWGQYLAASITFCLAAGTDWLDGYLARKWGQITVFGRILDPFVDKVLICGAFIMLAAIADSGIAPWMAVLVTGRELLVTTIRSFLEAAGKDFSAKWSGKVKMVLQCAAVIASLAALQYNGQTLPTWLTLALPVFVWGAVLSTVYSGVIYVWAATQLVQPQA